MYRSPKNTYFQYLDSYELWVKQESEIRFDTFGSRAKASFVGGKQLIACDLKVDAIKRLSGVPKKPILSTKACVEFLIRGEPEKTLRKTPRGWNNFKLMWAQEDGITEGTAALSLSTWIVL